METIPVKDDPFFTLATNILRFAEHLGMAPQKTEQGPIISLFRELLHIDLSEKTIRSNDRTGSVQFFFEVREKSMVKNGHGMSERGV
jgi:hypothetical protein